MSDLSLSKKGTDLLKAVETLRLEPYDDQTGKDAIQMGDDLVLEHSPDLDFAQAHPVELL